MIVLLPPSETKRSSGRAGRALDLASLRFPELSPQRSLAVESVRRLAADPDATVAALKLGPRQLGEVERNRTVLTSPTMPAIDRYTGVLYDALDARRLTARQRAFAHRHVVVHSALFGPVAALDAIPAYRLSASSRVPGLPLKPLWASVVADQLSAVGGIVLDLRSEGYVDLGPAPVRVGSRYLRVVANGADGRKRALNHFNKHAKGEFVRALIENGSSFRSVGAVITWARDAGFRVSEAENGVLELVLSS